MCSKKIMTEIDIQKLIDCCSEIEAVDYNSKFIAYDGQGYDRALDLRIKKNAKARTRTIIARYGGKVIVETAEKNKDLEYALQFI